MIAALMQTFREVSSSLLFFCFLLLKRSFCDTIFFFFCDISFSSFYSSWHHFLSMTSFSLLLFAFLWSILVIHFQAYWKTVSVFHRNSFGLRLMITQVKIDESSDHHDFQKIDLAPRLYLASSGHYSSSAHFPTH